MGAMDHAKSFLNIVRTVQLDDIRAQLAQPPLALIVADDSRAAQQFAFALAGGDAPDEAAARATMTVASPEALAELAMGPTPYDAVILIDPTPETRRNRAVQRLIAGGGPTAVLAMYTRQTAPDPGLPSLTVARLDDPAAVSAVRARLVTLLPTARRLAWGKSFAGFRKPISDVLVNETARANAQFAIMADLGARIPIFGGAVATGADFLVLTKNQLVLAYQLAAMNGRDLDDPAAMVTNAAPFFLAGLGWREVARRAIRLVPGAPLVPKAVVAYGGTMVSGALAHALTRPEGVQAWVDGVQQGVRQGFREGGRFAGVRQGAEKVGRTVRDRVRRPGKLKARVVTTETATPEPAADSPVEVLKAD